MVGMGERAEIGGCLFGFTGIPRTRGYVGKWDL